MCHRFSRPNTTAIVRTFEPWESNFCFSLPLCLVHTASFSNQQIYSEIIGPIRINEIQTNIFTNEIPIFPTLFQNWLNWLGEKQLLCQTEHRLTSTGDQKARQSRARFLCVSRFPKCPWTISHKTRNVRSNSLFTTSKKFHHKIFTAN